MYHLVHTSSEAKHPQITLPILGHAIAGSAGAAISNPAVYPLALIVTRLQVKKQNRSQDPKEKPKTHASLRDAELRVYSDKGGPGGLYTGVLPDTFKTVADSFLFFLAYTYLRRARLRAQHDSSNGLPIIEDLSVGILAGAFSKFFTTPIANVVTRQQAAPPTKELKPYQGKSSQSFGSVASQIDSERGIRGFWSGYSASLVLTLNPSLTFLFFEILKRMLLRRKHRASPRPLVTFLLAASSKAFASMITYPFSLVKSRMQASTIGSEEPSNVLKRISDILRIEGVGALYEGLEGEILKGFFSHGTTMLLKDIIHKAIILVYFAILKVYRRYSSTVKIAYASKTR